MQGNGIDGLAVVTLAVTSDGRPNANYIGPVESHLGPGGSNQTVNSVWDDTDLTYVLRGTIVLAGATTSSAINTDAPARPHAVRRRARAPSSP